MCGRYIMSYDNPDLKYIINSVQKRYPLKNITIGEIYPSSYVPVFLQNFVSTPDIAKWGLVIKNKKYINARAETAFSNYFFKYKLAGRRLAIPCSGFYEFDSKKEKYLFTLPNCGMFYLAGFCDQNRNFVILTTGANQSVSPIHPRMPVVINPNNMNAYLQDIEFVYNYINSPMPNLDMTFVPKI